ncbi:DUF1566 domain-containing protein [Sulfurimonas sp.]|uniref:Lcl domain-containing protein n=1 Tax=Sulfurimonas sp. TaxID=2022749 RepID=UPI003D0E1FC2
MIKNFIILILLSVIALAQDSIVVDKKQTLEWQDSDEKFIAKWKLANAYCEQLKLDGKDDWRLPSKEELIALAKDKELKKEFKNMTDNIFWSNENGPFDATTVFSGNGFSSSTDNCEKFATICVRSGR